MRIGIFTDTYIPNVNGVTTSVITLKEALEKKGHTVYIVTVNNDKYKFNYENRIIKIPGIKTGIYDYRLTEIYSFKAIDIIKKLNLDIIHSQTEFGIGTFARIVAKKYHIPLVHTYHTMYEDCGYYITKGYFPKISKRLIKRFTLFYCDKTVDELIVPTYKTYKLFKDKYKVKRDISIIETGIDIKKFNLNKKINKDIERKKLGLSKNDFVLLSLGRIAKEKNLDFLIESMNNFKNTNIKLLIIGNGPYEKKLKKDVIKYNLNNNIIFKKKVPWNLVYKYYKLSDLFVTASHSETQGLTVLEALSLGTPVVCINDDSFKNVVINNINGKIFKNKKEFTNIINTLYKDKKLLNKFINNATITGECFSTDKFCDRIIKVYKKAINNKNKEWFWWIK